MVKVAGGGEPRIGEGNEAQSGIGLGVVFAQGRGRRIIQQTTPKQSGMKSNRSSWALSLCHPTVGSRAGGLRRGEEV